MKGRRQFWYLGQIEIPGASFLGVITIMYQQHADHSTRGVQWWMAVWELQETQLHALNHALRKWRIKKKCFKPVVWQVLRDLVPILHSSRQHSLLFIEIKDPFSSRNLLFYSFTHSTTSAVELLHIRVILRALPSCNGYRVHPVNKQYAIIHLKSVWQCRCKVDRSEAAWVALIPAFPNVWILAFAKLFFQHNTHVQRYI